MKFIDELDVERLNQTLNFDLNDCKITGGCDIFTTKAVASDKKLYKTIDHNLNVLLQENESYNASMQQQLELEANASTGQSLSPFDRNSRNSNSFWEQKRRMSVGGDSNSNNNNGDTSNSSGTNTTVNGPTSPIIGGHFKSNKLNDQNLKELVSNSDGDYLSSSSTEFQKSRRASSVNSGRETTVGDAARRRSSLSTAGVHINIGPFGPITETASRRTFAYLIAILNASYPDHDFAYLEPNDFVKCSLKSLISKFENSLYSLGKKPEDWMWEVISTHMDLSDCVIYRYEPKKSFLEDEPGHLWGLIWFLFNKKRKRVAFLYLIASRLPSNAGDITALDERESNTARLKKKFLIDDTPSEYEGEYDLTYDDNAIEDDSNDEALII